MSAMTNTKRNLLTRREFIGTGIAATAAASPPFATDTIAASKIPVGLEMYAARETMAKDLNGTVRAVAAAGYQGLEFYAPYYDWTSAQAKDMRKLLDDLGIRCFSTHNDSGFFTPEKIGHARELNLILGSKYMVMASSHEGATVEAWQKVADALNTASEKLASDHLGVGYHNHQVEWKQLPGGVRPMDILANTKPSVVLQL